MSVVRPTESDSLDPNAILQEQLALSKLIQEPFEGETAVQMCIRAKRLAEIVIALDEWIDKGGMLPSRWIAFRPWRPPV